MFEQLKKLGGQLIDNVTDFGGKVIDTVENTLEKAEDIPVIGDVKNFLVGESKKQVNTNPLFSNEENEYLKQKNSLTNQERANKGAKTFKDLANMGLEKITNTETIQDKNSLHTWQNKIAAMNKDMDGVKRQIDEMGKNKDKFNQQDLLTYNELVNTYNTRQKEIENDTEVNDLFNKAVKGNTLEEKRANLAKLAANNPEPEILSRKVDDIFETIKSRAAVTTESKKLFDDQFSKQLSSLENGLKRNMTSLMTAKLDAYNELKKSGAPDETIQKNIARYDTAINDYQRMAEVSIKKHYEGVGRKDMAKSIADELGESTLKKMYDNENNLTKKVNIDLAKNEWNDSLLGAVKSGIGFLGAGLTELGQGLKSGKQFVESKVLGYDEGKALETKWKNDFNEVNLYGMNSLPYISSYLWNNADDIIPNLRSFATGSGVMQLPKVLSKAKAIKEVVENRSIIQKGGDALKYGLKEAYESLPGNVVINNSLKDINSTERMVSDFVFDAGTAKIIDSITGKIIDTGISGAKKGAELFGVVTEDKVAKQFGELLGDDVAGKQMQSYIKSYSDALGGSSLKNNKQMLDYGKNVYNDMIAKGETTNTKDGIFSYISNQTRDLIDIKQVDLTDIEKKVDALGDQYKLEDLSLDKIELDKTYKILDRINSADQLFYNKGLTGDEIKGITEVETSIGRPVKEILNNQIKTIKKHAEELKINFKPETFKKLKADYDKLYDTVDLVSEKLNKGFETMNVYVPATGKIMSVPTKNLKQEGFTLKYTDEAGKESKVDIVDIVDEVRELQGTDAYKLIKDGNIKSSNDFAAKQVQDFLSTKFGTEVPIVESTDKGIVEMSEIAIVHNKGFYNIVVGGRQLKNIGNTGKKVKLTYYKGEEKVTKEVNFNSFDLTYTHRNNYFLSRLINTNVKRGEIDKFMDQSILELNYQGKDVIEIDYTVNGTDLRNVNYMIKSDIKRTAKMVLSDTELNIFMKTLDDTLFSNKQSSILLDISKGYKDAFKGKGNVSMYNFYANLMQGYATIGLKNMINDPSLFKNIVDIINDSNIPNKTKRINELLLRGGINKTLFDGIDLSATAKATGIKVDSDFIGVHRKTKDEFIEQIVSYKDKSGVYTRDEINEIRKNLDSYLRLQDDKSVDLYLSKLNDTVTGFTVEKVKASVEVETRSKVEEEVVNNLIEQIKQTNSNEDLVRIVDEINNNSVSKEEAKVINKEIERVQEIKYKNIVDPQFVSLAKTVQTINDVVNSMSAKRGGSSIRLEDAKGGDNPIIKSIAKTLNPFVKSNVTFPELEGEVRIMMDNLILDTLGNTEANKLSLSLDRTTVGGLKAYDNVLQETLAKFTEPRITGFVKKVEVKKYKESTYPILVKFIDDIKETIIRQNSLSIRDGNKLLETNEIINELFGQKVYQKIYIDGKQQKIDAGYSNFSVEDLLVIFNNRKRSSVYDGYVLKIKNKNNKDDEGSFGKSGKTLAIEEYKKYYNYLYKETTYKDNLGNQVTGTLKPLTIDLEESDYLKLLTEGNKEKLGDNKLRDIYRTQKNNATFIKLKEQAGVKINKYDYNSRGIEVDQYADADGKFDVVLNMGEKGNLGISIELKNGISDIEHMTYDDFEILLDSIFKDLIIKDLGFKTSKKGEVTDKDVQKISKRLGSSTYADSNALGKETKLKVYNFVVEERPLIEHLTEGAINNGIKGTQVTNKKVMDIYKKYKTEGDFNKIKEEDIDLIVNLYNEWDPITDFKLNPKDLLGSVNLIRKKKFEIIMDAIPTDGSSYITKEQIDMMSEFQKGIHKGAPIKMHVGDLGNFLFKTLWNPIGKTIDDTPVKEMFYKKNFGETKLPEGFKEKLFKEATSGNLGKALYELGEGLSKQQYKMLDSYIDDISRVRYIGSESFKVGDKNKFEGFDELKDSAISIDGVKSKIIGMKETDTSHDMYTPNEVEADKHFIDEDDSELDINGFKVGENIQYRNRIGAIGNELISQYMLSEINKLISDFKDQVGIKVDIELGNISEVKANMQEIALAIKGNKDAGVIAEEKFSILSKKISKIISGERKDGVGFRGELLPRIYIENADGTKSLIKANQVGVNPEKFKQIEKQLLNIGDKYYTMDYRSPIPNSENIGIKEIVVDYSLEDTAQLAIHPTQVYINKQADFDGDHLNILFINNKSSDGVAGAYQKLVDLGLIDVTKSDIINKVFTKKGVQSKFNDKNISDLNKDNYVDEKFLDEILKEVKDALELNGGKDIKQQSIPVLDITEIDAFKKLIEKTVKQKFEGDRKMYGANLIAPSGKDNISVADAHIRTFDILSNHMGMINLYDDMFGLFNQKTGKKFAKDNPYRNEYSKLLKQLKLDKLFSEDKIYKIIENSLLFKQIAAAIEQTVLDLAKNEKIDRLPKGWETIILSEVLGISDNKILEEMSKAVTTLSTRGKQASNLLGKGKSFIYEDTKNGALGNQGIIMNNFVNVLKDLKPEGSGKYYKKVVYNAMGLDQNNTEGMYNILINQLNNISIEDKRLISDIMLDKFGLYLKTLEEYKNGFIRIGDYSIPPYKLGDYINGKVIEVAKIVDGKIMYTNNKGNKITIAKYYKGMDDINDFISTNNLTNFLNDTMLEKYGKLEKISEGTMDLPIKSNDTDYSVRQILNATLSNITLGDELSTVFMEELLGGFAKNVKYKEVSDKLDDIYSKIIDMGVNPEQLQKIIDLNGGESNIKQIRVTTNNSIEIDPIDRTKLKPMPYQEEAIIKIDEDTNLNEDEKLEMKNEVMEKDITENVLQQNLEVKTEEVDELQLAKAEENLKSLSPDVLEKYGTNIFSSNIDFFKVFGENKNNVLSKTKTYTDDLQNRFNEGMFTNILGSISNIYNKNFTEEALRMEQIARQANLEMYQDFMIIRKSFKFSKENDKVLSRVIDNLVFMSKMGKAGSLKRTVKIDGKTFTNVNLSDITDPDLIKYAEEIGVYFDKHISPFMERVAKTGLPLNIDEKTIHKISSSILEDIAHIPQGRTHKISLFEKGIYNIKDLEQEATKRGIDKTNATKLSEAMFEVGIFKWLEDIMPPVAGVIKGGRQLSFELSYGTFSWRALAQGGGGFIVGISQMVGELFQQASFAKSIKNFNTENYNRLLDTTGLMKNFGIDSTLPTSFMEEEVGVVRKRLSGVFLEGSKLSKNKIYSYIAYRGIALIANPLIITDLLMDQGRKKAALSNALYYLGYKDLKKFEYDINTLPKDQSEELLNSINLIARSNYADISGGATSSNNLYRETALSRMKALLPFSYLTGWSNRIMSVAANGADGLMRGMNEIAKGNVIKGVNTILRDTRELDSLMSGIIMSAALYSKINSREDYKGKDDNFPTLQRWVGGLNNNLAALEMSLPGKFLKAATFETDVNNPGVRLLNGISEVFRSTFKELTVGINMINAGVDVLKQGGDIDDAFAAVVQEMIEKSASYMAYNKAVYVDSLYGDFANRSMFATVMGIGELKDEEVAKHISKYEKDLLLEDMIENGKLPAVMIEMLQSFNVFSGISRLSSDKESYDMRKEAYRDVMKYMYSEDFYKNLNNKDYAVDKIADAGHIESLIKAIAPYQNKLDMKDFELQFIDSLRQLNESMLIKDMRVEYGEQGFKELIMGKDDKGIPFIKAIDGSGNTMDQMRTNQIIAKLAQVTPNTIPTILSVLVNKDISDAEYNRKKEVGYKGTEAQLSEEELLQVQKDTIKKYMPLIRASRISENQLAGYLIASEKPEFVKTIMNDKFLKPFIADKIAMKIAIHKDLEKGNNVNYLDTTLGAASKKLSYALSKGQINEEGFKTRLLELYNYGLNEIHNNIINIDRQLEMKTAMYKGLGEHANILNNDPTLGQYFADARVNLQNKLFDDIQTMGANYTLPAIIAVAEGTGRMNRNSFGPSGGYSSGYGSGYGSMGKGGQGFPKQMQQAMPKMRSMLNQPMGNFKPSGKSGYQETRPRYILPTEGFTTQIELFRKTLFDQYSIDLIKKTAVGDEQGFRKSKKKAETVKKTFPKTKIIPL